MSVVLPSIPDNDVSTANNVRRTIDHWMGRARKGWGGSREGGSERAAFTFQTHFGPIESFALQSGLGKAAHYALRAAHSRRRRQVLHVPCAQEPAHT